MIELVLPVLVMFIIGISCYYLAFGRIYFLPVTILAGLVLAAVFKTQSVSLSPVIFQIIAFGSYVSLVFFGSQTLFFRLDTQQRRALRFFVIFMLIFVSITTLLFSLLGINLIVALFFACLLCAVIPHSDFFPVRVREILEYERAYSALFCLVIPLFFVYFFPNLPLNFVRLDMQQYILGIILSIGVGVFVGILFSKIHVFYHRNESIFSVLLGLLMAFVTYSLADVLGAFGWIATAVFGLFCIHVFRSSREKMYEKLLSGILLTFSILGVSVLFAVYSSHLGFITFLLVLFFYGARIIATLVSLGSVLRKREYLLLALYSPVSGESLVVLFFLHTMLLPVGVTSQNILLLSQATMLLVLVTHAVSLLLLPLKHLHKE